MKISKWFQDLKDKCPYWSDLMIFNTCISGKSLYKTDIVKSFKQLVDKEEYSKSDLEEILEHTKSLISKKH